MKNENDDEVLTMAANLSEAERQLIRRMKNLEVGLVENGELSQHWRNEIMIHLARSMPASISDADLSRLLRAEFHTMQMMPAVNHREKVIEDLGLLVPRVYAARNKGVRK